MLLSRRVLKLANTVLVAACTVVSAAMDAAIGDLQTVRLPQVRGDGDKTNDVLFCGTRRPAERNVIYFTGDVQVN